MIEIRSADPADPPVADLLAYHHREAGTLFPVGYAYALPPTELADPAITLFAAWEAEDLLGIAALREMGGGQAELKAMRTHPDRLRRGAARLLLDRIVDEARSRGLARLSLETGVGERFVAANALYEAAGFTDCAAFGDYPPSPHNRFMTQELQCRP